MLIAHHSSYSFLVRLVDWKTHLVQSKLFMAISGPKYHHATEQHSPCPKSMLLQCCHLFPVYQLYVFIICTPHSRCQLFFHFYFIFLHFFKFPTVNKQNLLAFCNILKKIYSTYHLSIISHFSLFCKKTVQFPQPAP